MVTAPAFAKDRMWIGFHDDPVLRFGPDRQAELDIARSNNATMVRTLVTWRSIAPQRPANAANPFDPAASPLSADVPLMIGFTRNEANFTPNPIIDPIDDARLNELVKGVFPNITQADIDRLVSAVRTVEPGVPNHIAYQLIASQNTGAAITLEADRKAEQKGAPAYVYYFTHTVAARRGKLGAPLPDGRGTTLTGRGTTLTGAGGGATASGSRFALGSFSSPIVVSPLRQDSNPKLCYSRTIS